MRPGRGWRRLGAAAGAAALVAATFSAVVGGAPQAQAQSPNPLQVTYVARVCDAYTDIMANKARNNLQESLFNLGPDSTYAPNDIVDPAREAAGSPNCRPLTGWTFSTGQGITPKSPATQNLSTVTGLFRSDITTQASTPLLDAQGNPVIGPGGQAQTIDGAVTVQLNAAEASFAQSGRTVWVQGGTPAQALNGRSDIGFGALRCAQDALNGDNVDAVTFPQSRTHVFCFYYAVSPPPPPGTITVVKQVNGALSDTFGFQGNISYNPGGTFAIAASPGSPGSMQFIRGATLGSVTEPPWSFTEQSRPGWQAPSPAVCTSANGLSVITISGATTTVNLAAGDSVTCTYTNTPTPLGIGVLAKRSFGAVGSFPFAITGPNTTENFTATTTTQGEPTVFATRVGAPSGNYTATETYPTDFSQTGPGTWSMTGADCNGSSLPISNTPSGAGVTFTAAPGTDVACLFTNSFAPSGAINIFKTTNGGVGRFEYTVLDSADNLTRVGNPVATTTTPGVEVQAQPSVTGLSAAAPGTDYTIVESMPAPDSEGFWVLDSVDCGGNTVSVDQATASAVVQLRPDAATADCRFVNRFQLYGTFSVTKTTTPDLGLRPDDAVIVVDCGGSTIGGTFTVPAGTPGNDSGVAVTDSTLTCTVSEPDTGAATGVDVTTTAFLQVDGGPQQPYTLGQPFTVEVGHATEVVIANTMRLAPPPTPTPTPTPAPAPPTGPSSLANTGSSGPQPWIPLAGALLIASGVVMARAARVRRTGKR
ncbi:prealbumin-like fold domain-containing protein [Leifsonia sp. P73]|uniref:prealbumin-like fold domain-containing protein n=1 Tax=Leifsonia sp. P73 TaxID=3423959 RepID=UPI003DA5853E